MSWDRAVVGLAAIYSRPSRNGHIYGPSDFRRFVRARPGIPLLAEHRGPRLGTWRGYRSVHPGSTPPGLLAYGEITDRDLLRRLATDLDPLGRGAPGLSIHGAPLDDHLRDWWLREISITDRPASEYARVLGVGPYAADVWELLTGTKPPQTQDAPTTVARLTGQSRDW